MAKVPEYGVPQVRLQGVQVQKLSPSAASEGARQQQSAFGALTDAGRQMGDIALKMQERDNADAVLRAETDLTAAETEFHNAIKGRLGENSKGASQEAVKFWQEQDDKIGRSLANDAQRRAFQKIAAQRRASSMQFVTNHEATEQRKALVAAAESAADAAKESGIANPAMADVSAQRIRAQLETIGTLNGLPKERVDQLVQAKVTEMHSSVVGSLIDQYPERARAYLKEYGDEITPSERRKLEESLRGGEVKGFAQRKATEIMTKYPDDDEKQLQAARDSTTNAEKQEALVAQIKARQNERETIRKREQIKAVDDAYAIINKGTQPGGTPVRTVWDLPGEVRDKLDPSDWSALEKELSGATVKTDYGLYYDLRELARTNPEKFVDPTQTPLSKYFGQLSTSKRDELIKLREDILAGKEKPGDAVALGSQLTAAHNVLDFGTNDREKKGAFDYAVHSEIAAEQDRLGRKLDQKERQAIIDRMMIRSDGWLGDYFYEVYGDQQATAEFVQDVPDDFRNAAVAALERNGRQLDGDALEKKIQEMYAKHLGVNAK